MGTIPLRFDEIAEPRRSDIDLRTLAVTCSAASVPLGRLTTLAQRSLVLCLRPGDATPFHVLYVSYQGALATAPDDQ